MTKLNLKLTVSYLQPKFTKGNTECVNNSRKQRPVEDEAYTDHTTK